MVCKKETIYNAKGKLPLADIQNMNNAGSK